MPSAPPCSSRSSPRRDRSGSAPRSVRRRPGSVEQPHQHPAPSDPRSGHRVGWRHEVRPHPVARGRPDAVAAAPPGLAPARHGSPGDRRRPGVQPDDPPHGRSRQPAGRLLDAPDHLPVPVPGVPAAAPSSSGRLRAHAPDRVRPAAHRPARGTGPRRPHAAPHGPPPRSHQAAHGLAARGGRRRRLGPGRLRPPGPAGRGPAEPARTPRRRRRLGLDQWRPDADATRLRHGPDRDRRAQPARAGGPPPRGRARRARPDRPGDPRHRLPQPGRHGRRRRRRRHHRAHRPAARRRRHGPRARHRPGGDGRDAADADPSAHRRADRARAPARHRPARGPRRRGPGGRPAGVPERERRTRPARRARPHRLPAGPGGAHQRAPPRRPGEPGRRARDPDAGPS